MESLMPFLAGLLVGLILGGIVVYIFYGRSASEVIGDVLEQSPEESTEDESEPPSDESEPPSGFRSRRSHFTSLDDIERKLIHNRL